MMLRLGQLYVCMYVCMYGAPGTVICIYVCMYVCMVCLEQLYVCMYVYMYVICNDGASLTLVI
jgi:hypothetical protein